MSLWNPFATAGILATLAAVPAGALQQQEYRASDGTAYQVIRVVGTIGGGAESEHITTVAGARGGVGSCNASTSTAAAITGALPPLQVLHPFGSIKRTAILLPNDITALAFDPAGAGKVTLGSGVGAAKICRTAADCAGGAVALSGLGTAGGGVPAACIANGVAADCDLNQRQTLGFGLAASGSPPVCQASPTVNTTICASVPSDGFPLTPGQAIVFIYNGSLGGAGFGVGVGSFGIDSDESGSVCPDGGVVSAAASSQSLSGPGQPPGNNTPAPAASHLGLLSLVAALALWGGRRLRAAA
jgi:hypothetical protein